MKIADNMAGVILAAGRGKRMAPLSVSRPKPLLPVCNVPLIFHQIQIMKQAGIREVFVVVGHLRQAVCRAVEKEKNLGVKVRFVEQARVLGIAHAVGCLEPYVSKPFLLFLGDIYFKARGLGPVLGEYVKNGSGTILFVSETGDPESIKGNFGVTLDSVTGRVRRVIEKPRRVENNLKGCGVYLFDPAVFDATRKTPRTAMRDEYELTDSIQILIDMGENVHVSRIIEKDINLTTPADLLEANLFEMKEKGLSSLADASSVVPGDSKIIRSVVGAGCVVWEKVTLKDCLVLENACVKPGVSELSRHVITRDGMINCGGKGGMP